MSVIATIGSGFKPDPSGEYSVEPCPFAEEYPGLFEVIARHRFEGKDRQVGRLIIYTEPGKGCVCLCDKDSGQVAFHVADSVADALAGVERRLQEGALDWRDDKRKRYGLK